MRKTIEPSAFRGLSILLLPLILASAGAGLAEPDKAKPAMRDAASHDDLAKLRLGALKADPMKKLEAASEEANAEEAGKSRNKDLFSTSDVLCYGGTATLVPKRAILHVPKRYADRFKIQKGAKIKTFPEFARFNKPWVKTLEVTREQAAGTSPFDEKILEELEKSTMVVVATFQGGPISVLPPKPDLAEAASTTPNNN